MTQHDKESSDSDEDYIILVPDVIPQLANSLEKEFYDLQNQVRANPLIIVPDIEKQLSEFDKSGFIRKDGKFNITTKEGK